MNANGFKYIYGSFVARALVNHRDKTSKWDASPVPLFRFALGCWTSLFSLSPRGCWSGKKDRSARRNKPRPALKIEAVAVRNCLNEPTLRVKELREVLLMGGGLLPPPLSPCTSQFGQASSNVRYLYTIVEKLPRAYDCLKLNQKFRYTSQKQFFASSLRKLCFRENFFFSRY